MISVSPEMFTSGSQIAEDMEDVENGLESTGFPLGQPSQSNSQHEDEHKHTSGHEAECYGLGDDAADDKPNEDHDNDDKDNDNDIDMDSDYDIDIDIDMDMDSTITNVHLLPVSPEQTHGIERGIGVIANYMVFEHDGEFLTRDDLCVVRKTLCDRYNVRFYSVIVANCFHTLLYPVALFADSGKNWGDTILQRTR